jgi:hypothetical protein
MFCRRTASGFSLLPTDKQAGPFILLWKDDSSSIVATAEACRRKARDRRVTAWVPYAEYQPIMSRSFRRS